MLKWVLIPLLLNTLLVKAQPVTAVTQLNSYYGVTNTKGQFIIPCIYRQLTPLNINGDKYYIVSRYSKYGILNESNQVVVPLAYDKITKSENAPSYVVIKFKEKEGLLHVTSRKIILPAIYDRVTVITSDLVRMEKVTAKLFTFFNLRTNKLFSNLYSDCSVNTDNRYIVVEQNGRKGMIDFSEKIILPIAYSVFNKIWTNNTTKTYYIAAKDGKYGILSIDGRTIVPFEYDMLAHIFSGPELVVALKNGKKGLLSQDGNVVLNLEYDDLTSIYRYYLVKKKNKYGLVSQEGRTLLPAAYDSLTHVAFSYSINITHLLGIKNGKKGIVDATTGKPRVEFIYDDLIAFDKNYSWYELFHEYMIAVKDGKYGMIGSKEDSVILPFEYEDLQYANSSLVIARRNGKYGVVDMHDKNNILLPFEYQFINYDDGVLGAYKDGFEKYHVSSNKITKINN